MQGNLEINAGKLTLPYAQHGTKQQQKLQILSTVKTGYSQLYSIAENKSESKQASKQITFFLQLGMATPRCF